MPTMHSKLLDFLQGRAVLVSSGLDLLRSLQSPITIVTFVGDGRSGKSFLAQRFGQQLGLPEGSFNSAPSQAPVTVGIDVAVVPFNGGSLVIADCEGSNNAQAAVRQMVHVLGSIFAGQLVFVCGGQAAEPQLQTLGHALAARELLRGAAEGGLAAPNLVFTVNKKDPTLDEQCLDVLLREQHDVPRNSLRASIKAGYPSRRLFTVPFMTDRNFEDKLQELRGALLEGARPLTVGGVPVAGPQLAQVLQTCFDQMMQQQAVDFPDVLRFVVYDGHLRPLAERLAQDFELGLSAPSDDFITNLANYDTRQAKLQEFRRDTAHIRHEALKTEALGGLTRQMKRTWQDFADRNTAVGRQVGNTSVETREELVSASSQSRIYYEGGKDWCACLGSRVRYCESGGQHILNVYASKSRSQVVHKDCSIVYSEWVETGRRQAWQ